MWELANDGCQVNKLIVDRVKNDEQGMKKKEVEEMFNAQSSMIIDD